MLRNRGRFFARSLLGGKSLELNSTEFYMTTGLILLRRSVRTLDPASCRAGARLSARTNARATSEFAPVRRLPRGRASLSCAGGRAEQLAGH